MESRCRIAEDTNLRNLRIPIPKTLDNTLCRAYLNFLKPFGRKLLIKPHWAPRLEDQ